MKVHLYDFRWLDENTTEFQASFQNKLGRKQIHRGDFLSLENCSTPKCAGSMNPEGIWSPCPENTEGKAKCDLCKMKERNFIFTVFDGFDRSNVNETDLKNLVDFVPDYGQVRGEVSRFFEGLGMEGESFFLQHQR